jgi:hypothetical protein
MIVTAREIREALMASLSERIGTYTFSDGQTTPAVRTDDGSDPYEEEPRVEGLEVVIAPSLEVSVNLLLNGYQETYGTLIVLKQWDIAQTAISALDSVLEAIAEFSTLNIGQIRRVIRSTQLDNIETLTIPIAETVLTTDD